MKTMPDFAVRSFCETCGCPVTLWDSMAEDGYRQVTSDPGECEHHCHDGWRFLHRFNG